MRTHPHRRLTHTDVHGKLSCHSVLAMTVHQAPFTHTRTHMRTHPHTRVTHTDVHGKLSCHPVLAMSSAQCCITGVISLSHQVLQTLLQLRCLAIHVQHTHTHQPGFIHRPRHSSARLHRHSLRATVKCDFHVYKATLCGTQ